jgi:hypothetical protein
MPRRRLVELPVDDRAMLDARNRRIVYDRNGRVGPNREEDLTVIHEWRLSVRSWSDRAGAEWVLRPVDGESPEWRFRQYETAAAYAETYDPEGGLREGAVRPAGCEDC